MGHLIYDIFLIINVSFMELKFYHGHHLEKYRLQNQSFPNEIGIFMLGDIKYTSLDHKKFYFIYISLFCIFSIWT